MTHVMVLSAEVRSEQLQQTLDIYNMFGPTLCFRKIHSNSI